MRSTAPANEVPKPSRNATASASTPLPSASSVRKADAIAACVRPLVTWTGFGRAIVLDTMKTASGQRSSLHSLTHTGYHRRSFLAISRARQRLMHICENGLYCHIIGAPVAYGVIAFEARPVARTIVARRLQDGGNRIERPPVPGAGGAEDGDSTRVKRRRDMHQ